MRSQTPPKRPQFAYDTVKPGEISAAKFKVAAPREFGEVDCRVIGVGEGTIITRSLEAFVADLKAASSTANHRSASTRSLLLIATPARAEPVSDSSKASV